MLLIPFITYTMNITKFWPGSMMWNTLFNLNGGSKTLELTNWHLGLWLSWISLSQWTLRSRCWRSWSRSRRLPSPVRQAFRTWHTSWEQSSGKLENLVVIKLAILNCFHNVRVIQISFITISECFFGSPYYSWNNTI